LALFSASPKQARQEFFAMSSPLNCVDSGRPPAIRPVKSPGPDSANASHASRILVVDDETLIADTIVQILNRNGFIAEAAYGGKQAIAIAERHCPDLVLSDVLMPEIDGVEAAIAIRELCPDTRIVLFSGQAATVEILARAKERGHTFELLPKPIHPTELLRHLRK
jgi:CheY-like chemotaxis protein